MSITRIGCGPRMSKAVIHGNTVYLAGQVAEDPSQDITGQTTQILNTIDQLLASVGSDKTRLLMVQIFVANMKEFDGMNKAWDAWVPAGSAPPRATIEARLASADYKVEIVATAAV